jgi:cytochrome c oxidase cbb3-type subunit 3
MTTGQLREHAFDDIQEFDNRLPNWWLWTFYGACIFSVFYWIHYHTLETGDLPVEAYAIEQRAAAARLEAEMAKVQINEELLLKLASEPAVLAEGEKIFKNPALCAQCHKEDGSGNIGPNLTDRFWINGGAPMDIYQTVLEGGRPDKGMQGWKQNGMTFVQRAVAYVLSIRDRDLPGKQPEPEAKEYQAPK